MHLRFWVLGYARSVDSFWIEGERACVVVRGIQHWMPLEGEPARDDESVWAFGLRRVGDRWRIRTCARSG